jgi:hypothetical protein
MRETGRKGAKHGTREEDNTGAGCQYAAADRSGLSQREDDTVRPHSSLGYKPPAPAAWLTKTSQWHGKVESKERFPLSHTPDDYDESYRLLAALH